MTARPLITLLLTLLTACACSESGKAPEASSSSEAPAKQAPLATREPSLVDEHYQFELHSPGPGWELLGPEQARELNALGRAATLDNKGSTVIVLAEYLPGSTFEQTIELLNPLLPPDAKRERLDFQGHEALRLSYDRDLPDTEIELHVVHTVFSRDEHIFQVISGAPSFAGRERALELQETFVSREGELRRVQSTAPPVTEGQGLTWRIRDGRFESVTSGWRYSLPAGLEANFTVGEALAELGAFEMMVSTPANLSLWLSTTAITPEQARAAIEDAERDDQRRLGPALGESRRVTVAGHELEFVERQRGGLVYSLARTASDSHLRTLMLSYPGSLAGELEDQRVALLAGFEAIPPAELEPLRAELLAQVSTQRCLGSERSSYSGVVRRFDAKVSWTAPAGFWNLCSGAAEEGQEGVVLRVHEDELDISATLQLEPLETSPEQAIALTLAAAVHEKPVLERARAQVGELDFEWVMVLDPTAGLESHAYAVDGDRLLLWTQTTRRDSPAARVAMKSTLAGLDLAPSPAPFEVQGERTIDHRHGVGLRAPSDFVLSQGESGELRWTRGATSIDLLSAKLPKNSSAEWALDWIGRVAEAHVEIASSARQGDARAIELAGRPAKNLSWPTGWQVDVIVDRGWAHALLYRGLDEAEVTATRAAFELL